MTYRQPTRPANLSACSAVLTLLILAASGGDASVPGSGPGVEIPLDMAGGRPQIDVLINGKGPYTFVLDTGASLTVLDSALARELGLETIGEMEIGAPGMEQIPADLVRIDALDVHGFKLLNEDCVTMDLATMSGGRFLGVLRFGAFADSLVTLDLSAGTLLLSEESLDLASEDVIEYQDDDGLIDIPISIGDRDFMAHLDTGSPGRFALPGKLAEDLTFLEGPKVVGQVKLVGGQGTASKAKLDGTLAVGPLRFEDPEVTIFDLPVPRINLGSRFLADHVVRIDQQRRLIQFEPHSEGRVSPTPDAVPTKRVASSEGPAPSGGRRLGLRPAPGPPGPNGLPLVDGGLLVDSVDPGSLAAEAGLHKGDLVLSVNGTPMPDFDMPSLATLFRGSEPLRMEVRRAEGQEVEQVEIP